MKRARVVYAGAVHDATEVDGRVKLANGRVVEESAVVWLPPFEPRLLARAAVGIGDVAQDEEGRLGEAGGLGREQLEALVEHLLGKRVVVGGGLKLGHDGLEAPRAADGLADHLQ